MTVAERNELFASSIPVDASDPASRRYAVRRTSSGLECYEAKHTGLFGDVHEFHGHPTIRVPNAVLRILRDSAVISAAEYGALVRRPG